MLYVCILIMKLLIRTKGFLDAGQFLEDSKFLGKKTLQSRYDGQIRGLPKSGQFQRVRADLQREG